MELNNRLLSTFKDFLNDINKINANDNNNFFMFNICFLLLIQIYRGHEV